MLELGFKSIKTFKRDYISPLLENKSLEMTLPDKLTSKNQKYVTKK